MGVKARVMTILMQLGLSNAVVAYWQIKGLDTKHLKKKTLSERFTDIYADKLWIGNRDVESLSGTGSTAEAARSLAAELPPLLSKLNVATLLDLGCGDFNWMSKVSLPCKYTGVDIVQKVIDENSTRYANDDTSFLCLDCTTASLPYADAVICREVLFHLSFADGLRLLSNIKASGARYFLCTTDPVLNFNSDIPSGAWRDLNLEIKAFSFPRPLARIFDGLGDNPNRCIAVWDLHHLAPLTRRGGPTAFVIL